MKCNHPEPELCERLGRHIHGRIYELYKTDPRYKDIIEGKTKLTQTITHGPIPTKPKTPEATAAQKIANFGNALKRFAASGGAKVSNEEYKYRLSKCETCVGEKGYCDKTHDHWNCKICGCRIKEGLFMPGKARWATESCPHPDGNRWAGFELPVVTNPPEPPKPQEGGCGCKK